MRTYTLHLKIEIPSYYNTPQKRHDFGSKLATACQNDLERRGWSIGDEPLRVTFDVQTDEGTSEGPDDPQ